MSKSQTTKQASAIRRKRASLDRQKAKLSAAVQLLQTECQHSQPTMKYCGSSGNYDPSSNEYWIDWHCLDCGRHWTTEQGREHTDKYPNAVRVRT
jgi:hypothetical protein